MMKRTVITLIFAVIISAFSFSQPLTGIKNIPGDYTTVSNAIFALNSLGVGAGGVTFVIAGGYAETLPMLTSGLITATGTVDDPIVFQRGGAGDNPRITGCANPGTRYNYVIAIEGTDYITFDGLDVRSSDTVQEWGFAIFKASGTNGSQHVTIKNCQVNLSLANVNTVGIYANNVTSTAPAVQLTVTDGTGSNSFNRFSNNSISNAYNGIMIYGFNDATPYSNYDRNNDIGSDGANTIQNFGGSATACNGIFTQYQNNLAVKNNVVTGPVTGAGACAGIQLSTANDASANIMNNAVSIQYSGGGVFYGIFNNMGMVNNTNTINLNGNTISNCTYPTATGSICYYIYNNGLGFNTNVFDNTVTNNVYGSTGTTSTGTTYGIFVQGTTPSSQGNINVYNNSVTNNARRQSVTGSATTYYFNVNAKGSAINLYDNTVSNDSVRSSGSTYCYYVLGTAATKAIYGNTLSNILNANGTVVGFYSGNGNTCSIYRNKIQNIQANGATGTIYGIWASSLTNTGDFYIYNNLVSELKTPSISGTGTPATPSIYGIYLGGTNVNIMGCYNNTVYLDATTTGAQFTTCGIFATTSSKSLESRNNIVINNSTPKGSGLTVAFGYQTVGYANLAGSTNNNNYYAGVPASNRLIFYDGSVADQTIQDYKQRVSPREGVSVSENTTFKNTTTSPYNLHVDESVSTQVESSAAILTSPLSLTHDFDLNPRFPNAGYPDNPAFPATAPDMGADEFAGIADDKTPPVILYSSLMNTSSLVDRTLTATITDAHGVPVDGLGLPRICWKSSSVGVWNYVTGVSAGSNNYTFTFGGGVSLGDVISYFIVAQDEWTSTNIGSFPMKGAAGFSASPPSCSVPTSTPSTYTIISSICGTFNVGAGLVSPNYPTLTAAIADINQKEITCPVTLMLTDNVYSAETYPIILNNIPGASATNTLTIKPAVGATPSFATAYTGVSPTFRSMISLYGAQYVIIDGSNSSGTDRSMTFQNTGAGGFAAAIGLYNNGIIGASNIEIRNCVLQAHQELLYNAQGIAFYATVGNGGYNNVTIHNNNINSGKYGLSLSGVLTNKSRNLKITGNTIGSMISGNYIAQYGILVTNSDTVLIEGNEIIGPAAGLAPAQALFAVSIGSGMSNVKIRKNIIHDWNHTGANSGLGMYFDMAGNTTVTEVSDNLLYDLKAVGSNASISGGNPTGILVFSGANINFYHNTIHMRGNVLSPTVATVSTCIYIGGNGTSNIVTGIDLRDNILINSMQPSSGSPASKSYAVTTSSPYCFTTIDHNDYFVDGIGPAIGYLTSERLTLADWQGATGQDVNSMNVIPAFVSATDFHPTATVLNNEGVYLPSVPRDIVDVLRTNPPDMGAYEFGVDPYVKTKPATAVDITTATLNGRVMANNEFLTTWFDYGTTMDYGSSLGGTPSLVTGFDTTNISAALTGLIANTTYHFRARGTTPAGLIVFGEDNTFTTLSGLPENTTVTGIVTGIMDTCYNATNTITVAGGSNSFTVLTGGIATLIAGVNIVFLPGTTVQEGGYLHGYISTGTYCGAVAPTMPASATGEPEILSVTEHSFFSLYPNPTSGNFTLVQKGEKVYGNVKVEVFNINGVKVLNETMIGEKQHDFRLFDMPVGIYFVKVVADGYVETMKLVKI